MSAYSTVVTFQRTKTTVVGAIAGHWPHPPPDHDPAGLRGTPDPGSESWFIDASFRLTFLSLNRYL
jgi:hypothetical protein